MGPLNPPRPDLIVGLISFALVFVVFAKILVPRIEKTLAAREDAIEGNTERAVALHEEARRILSEYQAELSAARHEAARLREAATEEGAAHVAALRAEGARERDNLVASARAQLEADRIIAEAELREAVFTLATDLAGRIVGEPLADLTGARALADEFFAEVEAREPTKG
ncbi:F0F1 ATP synthase subunit B family protein [Streptomyces sp. NPDC026659]|uniref:F0F1 ATP synthase subunit B family protein n=1 Tax=Streptomyces sp. NPDC026659 TaxID=3155123 RepID=UPI0033C7F3E1